MCAYDIGLLKYISEPNGLFSVSHFISAGNITGAQCFISKLFNCDTYFWGGEEEKIEMGFKTL